MFGRKQSAFKLDTRRAPEDAVVAQPELTPPPQGQERIDLPFGEPTPVAARPERPITPRPDPLALFPDEEISPPRVATTTSSLLQLGAEETVGEAAQEAPSHPKRRGGRAKTRLLGIDHSDGQVEDVLAKQEPQAACAPLTYHAVGWLVIVDGPGRGHSMPLRSGVSQLGRGDDQSVQLDFGDTSISRHNHASIAFDEEQRVFFIGHGGKANLVRVNNAPVLTTEPLAHGDKIRMGETTLQLVAFCGADFVWADLAEQGPVSEIEDEIEAEAEIAAAASEVDAMEFETAAVPSFTQRSGDG